MGIAHRDGAAGTSGGVARAVGLAAGAAVIAWLPIGALIFVTNVSFPASDDRISFVAGLLFLMVAFTYIGARAGCACARPSGWLAACVVAGATVALLGSATYAVADTVFFTAVSTQPQTIADFRTSGMTSMRAFVNVALEHQVLVITIILVVMSVLLGMVGAVCAADARRRSIWNNGGQ